MYILGALLPSPPAVDTTNKKSGVLAGPTPVRGVLLPGHLSICRGFLVSSVWPIHIWCKHSMYVGTAAVDIKATTNRYPVVIHGRQDSAYYLAECPSPHTPRSTRPTPRRPPPSPRCPRSCACCLFSILSSTLLLGMPLPAMRLDRQLPALRLDRQCARGVALAWCADDLTAV